MQMVPPLNISIMVWGYLKSPDVSGWGRVYLRTTSESFSLQELKVRVKHTGMRIDRPMQLSWEVRIYSYAYGEWIFWEDSKSIQWGKKNLFNRWCWDNWIFTCKRRKLDPSFIPYTKTNSKLIKNRNARAIILLEGNRGKASWCWI